MSIAKVSLFRQSIQRGVDAGRRNIRPGLVLWLAGMVVVGGYYGVPTIRLWLGELADWKMRVGVLFSAVSTALFGGVVPLLFRRFSLGEKGVFRREGLFNIILWAAKGIEVDCLYRLQAWVFGSDHQLRTILLKTACDQLLYVPLWAMPTTLLLIGWHQSGYSWRALRADLADRWYLRQVMPVQVASWGVWIPAVSLIYCLPTALQLPMQNLVLCLWVLMLAVLMRAQEKELRD